MVIFIYIIIYIIYCFIKNTPLLFVLNFVENRCFLSCEHGLKSKHQTTLLSDVSSNILACYLRHNAERYPATQEGISDSGA